jgi:proline iminopeptidase
MSGFFPKATPRVEHTIAVEGGHALHVYEYGSAGGVPLVYLHGGPGGGTPPDAQRLFDPEAFRVVLFDQRGCGRSTCDDRLAANTTDHLLRDIDAIRLALGVDKWAVMGSSYGSLLAALYAARCAANVRWVVLHGVFLGSRAEAAWLFVEGGASRFYPQQWAAFEAAAFGDGAAPAERDEQWPPSLMVAYHDKLTQPAIPRQHPLAPSAAAAVLPSALEAAVALTRWEDEMETLAPAPASHEAGELLAGAQIAIHYFFHGCFLPAEGALPELRAAAAALSHVPCMIINGRHDVITPPHTASALAAVWPGARLRVVESGAHALFEKPMRTAAQACLLDLRQAEAGVADGRGGSRKRSQPP